MVVEPRKIQIQPCPGFTKKTLADYHLELIGLCGFKCTYCSSNRGVAYVRLSEPRWRVAVKDQLGVELDICDSITPDGDSIMIGYPDIVGLLEAELVDKPTDYGEGKTLVLSQLTDPFSPSLVTSGVTRRVLDLLLERTKFRIRILTKSAVIGKPEWVRFFGAYHDRFIVGMSITTLDDRIVETVERGTSKPSARIRAHRVLQDHGIPVYGMLCPILPDSVQYLSQLLDGIRPRACETVWIESVNPRQDLWSKHHPTNRADWSRYTTDLYLAVAHRATEQGWIDRLHYLLYESDLTISDGMKFKLGGYSLQGKSDPQTGRSEHFAFLGQECGMVHGPREWIERTE